MNRRKFMFSVAILAGIIIAGLAPPAEAGFRLRIEQVGGPGAVLTDTDNDGVITFMGAVGNFNLNITTGLEQPPQPINANAYAALDLNNVSVNAVGAGTLIITLEADGFTQGPDGPMAVVDQVGGTLAPGVTATFTSWANPTNQMPAFGADQGVGAIGAIGATPAGSAGTTPLTFTTSPFSGTSSNNFTKSGSYSLFSQASFTFGGSGGTISFDQTTFTTPAPGGLLLALAAVPALGVGYLRRRWKRPVVA